MWGFRVRVYGFGIYSLGFQALRIYIRLFRSENVGKAREAKGSHSGSHFVSTTPTGILVWSTRRSLGPETSPKATAEVLVKNSLLKNLRG